MSNNMAAIKMDMVRARTTSPTSYHQNGSDNNNGYNSKRRNSKMTTAAMLKEGITPLMLACQQSRASDIQNILRKKRDAIREQTRSKKVALHYCAEGGNVNCIELILEAGPSFLNAQDEEGYTPLHFGVINGNKDAVKALIDYRADVSCLDNEGHSLIHWATVCGELEILDILLSAGAPAATPDIHLAHPIHYAAQMCGAIQTDSRAVRVQSTVYGVSPKKGLAILRRLLQQKVPVDVRDQDGRQPLLWAASAGSADAILALVNAGAVVEAEDKDGLTALHCAASRGHVDCLENLIGLCGAEVDVIDNNGCTALFYAVTLGHADCTELLLNYGAEPNRQDRKGRSPAHTGASKGQLETIKLFAKHGGNLWLRNVRGDLPLHEAVLSRRKDLVMWLLAQRPDTVNAPNNDGRCPIHLAALNNNVEMVKILIDHHAEVNGLMRTGKGAAMTPLDAAIHKGNSTVAKFLQLHGCLPANSLNDVSLQRRLNRSLDSSQARTISSLQGSQLGSHNDFSPDQHHIFTSPEVVDKYASHVAEAIIRQGTTPIMDDGVQTDSSFYARDMQVQVSEDFPYINNDELTKTTQVPPTVNSKVKSSNSSASNQSSIKSGKKLRKKKSSLTSKDQGENNVSETTTESENEVQVRRSHSKGSIRGSRRSSKKSQSSVIPEKDQERTVPLPGAEDEINHQAQEGQGLENSETTNTTTSTKEQEQETSNESEKFSELENVARTSGGESDGICEEDLGIIEEDSTAESLTKTTILQNEAVLNDLESQIIQQVEKDQRTSSALTYRSHEYDDRRSRQGSAAKSRQDSGKTVVIKDSEPSLAISRSRSAATSARQKTLDVKRSGSTSSRLSPSPTLVKSRPTSGKVIETSRSRPSSSRMSNKELKPQELPESSVISEHIKRFPSPVSFISNPSIDGTDHDEILANESEPTLREAAAVRRKSETSLKRSAQIPSTKCRKKISYTTSGKALPKGTRSMPKETDEIKLQEKLLASKRSPGLAAKSRIPRSQETGIRHQNLSHETYHLKGDSGYSDQMIHTSASDDQSRFVYNQAIGSGTGGAVRRRFAANRRPDSFSSAKIIRRQSLLISPKKSSRSTRERERKRYEEAQKSLLGELDGGLNASAEETTSHGGSGSFTSEEGYRRYQQTASKRKQAPRAKFTFTDGEDIKSGRTSPKLKNLDIDTPISVTQAMQASMRKYNLERKIFQELLELKRLQIRSGKANEQVLVKRLADGYKKEGLSVNFREYDGPFTYLAFEKYLYNQLRLLQTNRKLLPRFAPSDDLEKLSIALKKMNATKLPFLDENERSESICDDHLNCTHLTHRCHHAAHAYTAIPCAYYVRAGRKTTTGGFLPQVDVNKAPGPIGQKSKSSPTTTTKPLNSITTQPFTPSPGMTMIVSPRRTQSSSPITLEVQQGEKTQVFSLPSQSLDPTKNYYVSLSIKPTPSPPVPLENTNEGNTTNNVQNNTPDGNRFIKKNDGQSETKSNINIKGKIATNTKRTPSKPTTNIKTAAAEKKKINQNGIVSNSELNNQQNKNNVDQKIDDHFGSLVIENSNQNGTNDNNANANAQKAAS